MKNPKKTTTKTPKTIKTTKSDKPPRAEKDATAAAFAYDASKDKVIKDYGVIETGTRAGALVVRVVSYNGGAAKLLIARTGIAKKTGKEWFTPKLGRLTGAEIDALLPFITKARKLVA